MSDKEKDPVIACLPQIIVGWAVVCLLFSLLWKVFVE